MINRIDLPRAYLIQDAIDLSPLVKLFHARHIVKAMQLLFGAGLLLLGLYAVLPQI